MDSNESRIVLRGTRNLKHTLQSQDPPQHPKVPRAACNRRRKVVYLMAAVFFPGKLALYVHKWGCLLSLLLLLSVALLLPLPLFRIV